MKRVFKVVSAFQFGNSPFVPDYDSIDIIYECRSKDACFDKIEKMSEREYSSPISDGITVRFGIENPNGDIDWFMF